MIKIMERSKVFISFGLVLVLLSVLLLFTRGLNLGIDFTGGTLLERGFDRPVTALEVKNALKNVEGVPEIGKSVVQPLENKQNVIIRTVELENEQIRTVDKALTDSFGKVDVRRTEVVGPVIGAELIQQALWALAIASFFVLLYVTLRFEYRFGAAAILAVVHDVAVTLGVLALTGREVNSAFVAAILTVVGYSLNDTIVIFDRIRENLSFHKRESLQGLVDRSINETMMRSINTSLTTLLVIGTLFVFGGSSIRDFTMALGVGVIAGTYSSIFVASPLWIFMKGAAGAKGGEVTTR